MTTSAAMSVSRQIRNKSRSCGNATRQPNVGFQRVPAKFWTIDLQPSEASHTGVWPAAQCIFEFLEFQLIPNL